MNNLKRVLKQAKMGYLIFNPDADNTVSSDDFDYASFLSETQDYVMMYKEV